MEGSFKLSDCHNFEKMAVFKRRLISVFKRLPQFTAK